VAGTHGIALPLDCAACHRNPVDILAAGHVDGAVTVTGYTGSDPNLIASVTDPGWNPATGSCATSYCHGASLLDGSNRAPSWTVVDGTQVACGTCHGSPPNDGRHYDHVGGGQWFANANCENCHFGIATGSGNVPISNGAIVDDTLHVNGARNVVFGGRYAGLPVRGYPTGTTATYRNGTCSNISCHRGLPDRGVGPYSWYP
jgi:predicted CxxxxCH...CXXCH cytochrome family protein